MRPVKDTECGYRRIHMIGITRVGAKMSHLCEKRKYTRFPQILDGTRNLPTFESLEWPKINRDFSSLAGMGQPARGLN